MNSEFSNWSDIRVFLAVLRGGSTLAASKTLGIAQPTVARRIDALEQALSVTLFERDTRGFHPTDCARHLTDAAEAMERAAQSLEVAAHSTRIQSKAPIRITAPVLSFSGKFSQILAEFTGAHPGNSFQFIASNARVDLIGGEADVALRFGTSLDDDRLIARKMTTVTWSLFAAPNYAARYGIPSSPDDLVGHKFVVMSGKGTRLIFSRWLADRISSDQIISHATDFESLVSVIKAGLGVGPLGTTVAYDHPELIQCFPPPDGAETFSWIVTSPAAWARPEVKDFVRFFAPRFKAEMTRQGAETERRATEWAAR